MGPLLCDPLPDRAALVDATAGDWDPGGPTGISGGKLGSTGTCATTAALALAVNGPPAALATGIFPAAPTVGRDENTPDGGGAGLLPVLPTPMPSDAVPLPARGLPLITCWNASTPQPC
jgi:hypothetical protein